MSDHDKDSKDTEYRQAERREQPKAAYDPYQRRDVSDQPGYENKNRENTGDFGFISQELATDELETPEPETDESRRQGEESRRGGGAQRDQSGDRG